MNRRKGTLPALAPYLLTATGEETQLIGASGKTSGVHHVQEDCDIGKVFHGDSFELVNDVIPKAWIIKWREWPTMRPTPVRRFITYSR